MLQKQPLDMSELCNVLQQEPLTMTDQKKIA